MKQLWLLALAIAAVGCSSGKSSSTGDPVGVNPSPNNNPAPSPSGPATQFGAGQHRVGTAIAAGRYYSDPVSGCYWERQSGVGGTLADVITNDIVSFDAGQWIVDILTSDVAFQTNGECGTWFNTPRRGSLGNTIPPGVWQVGTQIAAGTYTTNAQESCYWERRGNFQNTIAAVIDNDFADLAIPMSVTIAAGDAGFFTSAECGTWSRGTGIVPPAPATPPATSATGLTIASARDSWHARTGPKPGLP